MVFAKVISSANNISMLKQVSGTTFGLQSLIAESILTEEPDLVIALISENIYAKRYINQYLKEVAELARLAVQKDNKDLKDEQVRSQICKRGRTYSSHAIACMRSLTNTSKHKNSHFDKL